MTFEEWWASQIGKTFPGPKECFEAGREQGREEAAKLMEAFSVRLSQSIPPDFAGSLNCRQFAKAIRALGDEGGRK